MSTPNDRNELEFEDQLRRILRAEADEVSPSAEGLNLIRERTEHQRGSAWFGLPWLRPVTAVAAAVLIVASVIMSSPQVRDQVLEIVPAGADREGSPPEAHDEGDSNVAAPEPTKDSADGTSKPEEEPGHDPEDSPRPEDDPSAAEGEGLESTSSCPPGDDAAPTANEGSGDEDKKDKSKNQERDSDNPDCDPADEPADEPTDEPTTPGNGGEPGPDDGEDEPGSGSGGSGSGGGGSGGSGGSGNNSAEENSSSAN
ncbi:hypothetical protein [Nocardiopsis ganjiahuensis]|uniref:hypothetical protein n=1 Tax=Nocardiopsis ganjiahuensis TaxID=239984 RepID=UPI00034D2EDB|nr:hypothetical protein [Nocardiopsis ganjiahuensis]